MTSSEITAQNPLSRSRERAGPIAQRWEGEGSAAAIPEHTALQTTLATLGPIAIAVSGGIDSLTLATAAHRLTPGVTMHHAVSPAVPAEATARTRAEAARQGWTLDVFDAGEFSDPAYRENPVNRCFFCKTNLYGAIAARTSLTIASGTNTDDLGEYRPGLDAAANHQVRHPFVEAGISKAGVRRLAAHLGLGTLADLPSSPCLSSRIETGIRIEPPVLDMVHRAENLVARAIHPQTVRCRVRSTGFVIELDETTLNRLSPDEAEHLAGQITALGVPRRISFAAYRTGSAFLQPRP
jgi:uncharacterized protein